MSFSYFYINRDLKITKPEIGEYKYDYNTYGAS